MTQTNSNALGQKYTLPEDSKLNRDNFVFGVATSAYQIEGGAALGGRTPSIWDTFCRQPGAVDNQENGDVACDHYHLWKQDIQLIKELGVDAYRFSMSWSRIIPREGEVNREGLLFYKNIIDECHKNGLKVFVTLYHWDLPQYLEDKGGWLNRETAYKFQHYASVVSEFFGDDIDSYATLNEPFCAAYMGYRYGIHAPGIKGEQSGFLASHHLMLAHGLGVKAIRKHVSTSDVGCVFNATPAYPDSAKDRHAASYHNAEDHFWFIDPALLGRYPPEVLKNLKSHQPMILQGDLEIINQPLDFMGLNFYTRTVVKYDAEGDITDVPQPQAEHTYIGWEIFPQALTDLLLNLKSRYPNLPPIYITENGAAGEDEKVGEIVEDEQRVRYFQQHLTAVDNAIEQGVDIRGYFAWSLMDNFEWSFGYTQRFGIVHVDFETQKRTLKRSAICYQEFLKKRSKSGK